MTQPRIRALHHVQITVPTAAEADAREFYLQFLGLQEILKPASLRSAGGFWIQLGTQQVHISPEDGVDRSHLKSHIAYEVDDLEAWRQKLSTRRLMIEDTLPIDGSGRDASSAIRLATA
ncbi:MAG: glyoxalase [Anaerolineae bacterium]